MAERVSIQGYEGSFHQIAAREFLGSETEVVPCATFREVVRLAADKTKTTGGIMAIENSIAGSILPNYSLLQKSGLKIAGEIYLSIDQNLMALPGVKESEISEVHSHPMALLQCMDYLEEFPSWKLVESEDTALSARHIATTQSRTTAAIASVLAAELYGLEIIGPKIQSNKKNYTRFLYLIPDKYNEIEIDVDKASISFSTDHSRGSLARVLAQIADQGINLSKLQSMPIPEQEWRYSFHADMEFESNDQFNKMLGIIQPLTESLEVLGVYKKGKTV